MVVSCLWVRTSVRIDASDCADSSARLAQIEHGRSEQPAKMAGWPTLSTRPTTESRKSILRPLTSLLLRRSEIWPPHTRVSLRTREGPPPAAWSRILRPHNPHSYYRRPKPHHSYNPPNPYNRYNWTSLSIPPAGGMQSPRQPRTGKADGRTRGRAAGRVPRIGRSREVPHISPALTMVVGLRRWWGYLVCAGRAGMVTFCNCFNIATSNRHRRTPPADSVQTDHPSTIRVYLYPI